MTAALQAAVTFIISIIGDLVEFISTTDYPGLTISIAGVLIGFLMIDLGWTYFDYFLHASSHVKEKK